jgi:hypothetical protein
MLIMLRKIYDIKQTLETELRAIEEEGISILKKTEKSIYCINGSLKEIKQLVCNQPTLTIETEILIFKEIKPSIYCKLIYFIKIYNIESKRPTGSDKAQRKYLISELNKLEKFFNENLEFYQYMRNNMTFLDDKYFVRGKLDLHLFLDSFAYDSDPQFSTNYDFKVAKIMANDLLSVYLKSELAAIDRKEMSNHKNYTVHKSKYSWSESKASLVELIYAIKASCCINNGNIKINELTAFFETFFNIDLSDSYRIYLQIKGRQQPAKFLDALKTALLKKIEEQDD